jgi:hypothetical protein
MVSVPDDCDRIEKRVEDTTSADSRMYHPAATLTCSKEECGALKQEYNKQRSPPPQARACRVVWSAASYPRLPTPPMTPGSGARAQPESYVSTIMK